MQINKFLMESYGVLRIVVKRIKSPQIIKEAQTIDRIVIAEWGIQGA